MPLGSFSPHSPQTRIIAVLFTDILILRVIAIFVVTVRAMALIDADRKSVV